MVNDLFEERKNKQGKVAQEYYILENPPRNFMKQISELCEAMRTQALCHPGSRRPPVAIHAW
eukprot:13367140-Alexandrium_andersonii.AAC.1